MRVNAFGYALGREYVGVPWVLKMLLFPRTPSAITTPLQIKVKFYFYFLKKKEKKRRRIDA